MRDEYSRGEFESRNRQLPADLDQSAPYGSSARARTDFDSTPVGTPVNCYDVRSTFDVRPVGSFDFNIVSSIESSGDTDSGDIVVSMTVPDGFVAVLRNFDVWFNPEPVVLTKNGMTWSLQLNGGDVPYNADVPMGTAIDRETVFLLANEANRISLRLESSAFNNVNITGYVRFYGNLIPKSERALPFEIANPSGECITRTRTPTRVLPPAAPRPSPPPFIPPAQRVPIAPVVTASPASIKPPFPIQWRAQGRGNTASLIPIQNDLGQRRDLNASEIRKYFNFLISHPMKSKEKQMFQQHLRNVGVA
jgi:hypothetical protein